MGSVVLTLLLGYQDRVLITYGQQGPHTLLGVLGSPDDWKLAASAKVAPFPADPAVAAFVAAATRLFAGTAAFDAEFPLVNPPEWGRVVSAAAASRFASQTVRAIISGLQEETARGPA